MSNFCYVPENKKTKFVENINNEYNKQPYYEITSSDNMINIEKQNYNSKIKTNIELDNILDPFNYNVNYKNTIKKDLKGEEEYVYFAPYNQGPGRGFGNLNVGNKIRNSECSRLDTDQFKIFRESELNDRFEFLDNRFANPNNLVFPFPRSGETSRIATNLNLSSNINNYNFNKPKLNDDNLLSTNELNNQDEVNLEEPLPNINLIKEVENENNYKKNKQLEYKSRLEKIQGVIDSLKITYGNTLTRDIITVELKNKKLIE
jgi:hypothetical protein